MKTKPTKNNKTNCITASTHFGSIAHFFNDDGTMEATVKFAKDFQGRPALGFADGSSGVGGTSVLISGDCIKALRDFLNSLPLD